MLDKVAEMPGVKSKMIGARRAAKLLGIDGRRELHRLINLVKQRRLEPVHQRGELWFWRADVEQLAAELQQPDTSPAPSRST